MISSFYEKIVRGSPPAGVNEPKILCVGLVCLDIVHLCKHFPVEDSDERCVEYRWQRGGNASNNSTVLSKLGTPTAFLGIMGNARHNWEFLKDDMRNHKIDFSSCPMLDTVECPLSTVILSLNSTSRTILHYNANLPELKLEDVKKLDLDNYSWMHFEGRNIPVVVSMMQHIESWNNGTIDAGGNLNADPTRFPSLPITMSVELEKKNPELLDLLPYADVAFISKDFAKSRGYGNMSETLKNVSRDVKPGAVVICAWGDRGAMGRTPDGMIVQSPAFSPPEVVDTLGAGDAFVAATLHYLNMVKLSRRRINRANIDGSTMEDTQPDAGSTSAPKEEQDTIATPNGNIESSECSQTDFIDRRVLQGAVTFACRVAGAKVGSRGYEGIERAPDDLLNSSLPRVWQVSRECCKDIHGTFEKNNKNGF